MVRKAPPKDAPRTEGKKRSPRLAMATKLGIAGIALLLIALGLMIYHEPIVRFMTSSQPLRVMDKASVERNRRAAEKMFYHAYDNYMAHAFREIPLHSSPLYHLGVGRGNPTKPKLT